MPSQLAASFQPFEPWQTRSLDSPATRRLSSGGRRLRICFPSRSNVARAPTMRALKSVAFSTLFKRPWRLSRTERKKPVSRSRRAFLCAPFPDGPPDPGTPHKHFLMHPRPNGCSAAATFGRFHSSCALACRWSGRAFRCASSSLRLRRMSRPITGVAVMRVRPAHAIIRQSCE